jgi:WD40 repeat protein
VLLIQTYSTSLDEINRKSRKSSNTFGNPIKLPSKILAIAPDPSNHGAIYVAESASTIKRVALELAKVTNTYKGPAAPVTCICFGPEASIYAGCWDKSIWRWPIEQATGSGENLKAHVDFVKCLLSVRLGQRSLIISGGAEGDVIIWDPPSTKLHTIRGQSRAIQDLVVDPLSDPANPVIFVATSEREILHFTLSSAEPPNLQGLTLSEPIVAHETSVYRLFFDSDGDLWTASADKTAKHLVREDGWKADTTLEHPDFVRDIVVHERGGWVVTACRDEEIRVWNSSTGDLHHTFSGHFEEVTGLCLIEDLVVSVSIDATVRQWSLKPADLTAAREEAANPKAIEDVEEVKANPEALLTEEEEQELKELMENEERELQELMANDLQ